MILSREYLATYTYLKSEIKRIERRIKYYENHPLNTEYGVVKGSMQQFPFTECHYTVAGVSSKSNQDRENTIRQLIADLNKNKILLDDMKLDIETFLEQLPPEHIEMKHILALKYVDGKTDEEIGNNLGYHRTTVCKKIDEFLKIH